MLLVASLPAVQRLLLMDQLLLYALIQHLKHYGTGKLWIAGPVDDPPILKDL